MELTDILSEDAVLIGTDIRTKEGVLSALAERVEQLTGQSAAEVFEALSDRESLGSTGLGNGIAVPHGKFAPLKRVVAVFLKLPTPVEFDAIDDRPVDLVMMLLAPMGAGADHLKALARVARVLRTDAVAESLRMSNEPGQLYQILTQPVATTRAA